MPCSRMGRMFMTRGFSPVRSSYEEGPSVSAAGWPGGPVEHVDGHLEGERPEGDGDRCSPSK